MRHVYVVIGIWFAIAGVSTLAFGDPIQVSGNEPAAVVAGEPYVVNLLVTRYGRPVRNARSEVIVKWAGGAFTFRATEKGHDGIYRARVRVPLPGRFQYELRVNGRTVRKSLLTAKLTPTN
jgi:hypothetical protein